ncbi:MAG: sulfite exporter TauE/SafE family protein [Bacteroidota bacterium]|jgi:uncharacterized membrane protein YfcA
MLSNKIKKTRIPWLYLFFLATVMSGWFWYMFSHDSFVIYTRQWATVITMIFGSFIAGASPEGSAAVAYPIFTLILKIQPAIARNFAFAIQSIGMTSATLLIIGLRLKVDWNYIIFVTIGGVIGLFLGTYYVVPLVSPIQAKLFFVSLWLSFGVALWLQNRRPQREVFESIQSFQNSDKGRLIIFGLVGGIISSIFGTGINIFTFCLMTIYYRVSEKVATPSSVIIMTIETILGLFIHTQLINDFQPEAFEIWLACVPFVAIFAPLGAFVISKMPRKGIATLLYIILIVQFFGAMWVIKPSLNQALICGGILIFGVGLFTYLAKVRKE